jgi:hypothetical protein
MQNVEFQGTPGFVALTLDGPSVITDELMGNLDFIISDEAKRRGNDPFYITLQSQTKEPLALDETEWEQQKEAWKSTVIIKEVPVRENMGGLYYTAQNPQKLRINGSDYRVRYFAVSSAAEPNAGDGVAVLLPNLLTCTIFSFPMIASYAMLQKIVAVDGNQERGTKTLKYSNGTKIVLGPRITDKQRNEWDEVHTEVNETLKSGGIEDLVKKYTSEMGDGVTIECVGEKEFLEAVENSSEAIKKSAHECVEMNKTRKAKKGNKKKQRKNKKKRSAKVTTKEVGVGTPKEVRNNGLFGDFTFNIVVNHIMKWNNPVTVLNNVVNTHVSAAFSLKYPSNTNRSTHMLIYLLMHAHKQIITCVLDSGFTAPEALPVIAGGVRNSIELGFEPKDLGLEKHELVRNFKCWIQPNDKKPFPVDETELCILTFDVTAGGKIVSMVACFSSDD